MSGPLEGIRVTDCGWWAQGPGAAAILGSLGADVIKVEERVRGDPMRGIMQALSQADRQAQFETLNRNKRAIALDLKKEGARRILHAVIEKSDVLVHNFRTPAAKRLGLDYETVNRLNPMLVYAQASGWGPKGPDAEKGAFDVAAAARTGFMDLLGEEAPQRPPGGICDTAGAMCAALAILAALHSRVRLGRGQRVDVSLFGSTIALLSLPFSYIMAYGAYPPRPTITETPSRNTMNPLYNFYRCADGEWIYLLMLQADRHWSAFCDVMGIRELENDPRYETLIPRREHRRDLMDILDRVFATQPRSRWMEIFAERDLPCAPIQKMFDLANDPQAMANNYIVELDDPVYGREKALGLPYEFSETPTPRQRPCPGLGQHSTEILLELGYSWDDIARFTEEELI